MARLRILVSAVVLLLPLVARAVEPVVCGEEITGIGVLTADVDCSAAPDPTIYLRDANLELAGFTLTANVRCSPLDPMGPQARHCRVRGSGNLRGCLHSDGLLILMNADFAPDAGLCGVSPGITAKNITAKNITMSGYSSGMHALERLKIDDSTLSGIGSGAEGFTATRLLRLRDSTVSTSGTLVSEGEKARVMLVRANVVDSLAIGAHAVARPISLLDSTVTGSASTGVRGGAKMQVRRSTVTGSCASDPGVCADLFAGTLPKVVATTCGSSICEDTGLACGVCAND